MEIEFLGKDSEDCPLIRIYGTDTAHFSSLHDEVLSLAQAAKRECLVNRIPGFYPVSGCTLAMFSSHDEGVQQMGRELKFSWTLSPIKWSIVAGLIEPFRYGPSEGTYQWLSGREARYGLDLPSISVLLSYSDDGRW